MKPNTLFRALADETRLRCVNLVLREGELCVCKLTYALGLTQPKISRHLATLRASGLLVDRREGLWVYYRVAAELPARAVSLLEVTADALVSEAPFVNDAQILKAMLNRPGARICA